MAQEQGSASTYLLQCFGFTLNMEKNGDITYTINRVPGVQCEHTIDGTKPSSNEAKNNLGRVSETARGGANISPTPFQTDWQNECCQSSHPTRTSVLQMDLSEALRKSGQDYDTCLWLSENSHLVGHADGLLEWKDHPDETSGVDHRVRRINPGLGSDMPGFRDRRTLVRTRTVSAYQLPRASGSYPGSKNVRNEQNQSISTAQLDNTSAVAYINNQGGTISLP